MKKFVAFPQEDFLFKRHHSASRWLKTKCTQNLQTRPKIIIKWPEYQIENFPKKSMVMVSTLQVYRSQKFVWELRDGIRRGNLISIRAQLKLKKTLT
jgi:hypothetical protein